MTLDFDHYISTFAHALATFAVNRSSVSQVVTLFLDSKPTSVLCHMGDFGCGDGGWTPVMKINGNKVLHLIRHLFLNLNSNLSRRQKSSYLYLSSSHALEAGEDSPRRIQACALRFWQFLLSNPNPRKLPDLKKRPSLPRFGWVNDRET